MKHISKSVSLILILCMMSCALPSCKCHKVPRMTQMDTDKHESHVLQRVDTIYQHDSVFVREVMRGDTVYLTRTEYRDRWRIREVHDTIHNTQYITQTIEHPPERYVPKFYKWCTIALWAIGLLVMGYWLLKWWLKCRV